MLRVLHCTIMHCADSIGLHCFAPLQLHWIAASIALQCFCCIYLVRFSSPHFLIAQQLPMPMLAISIEFDVNNDYVDDDDDDDDDD